MVAIYLKLTLIGLVLEAFIAFVCFFFRSCGIYWFRTTDIMYFNNQLPPITTIFVERILINTCGFPETAFAKSKISKISMKMH